MTWSDLIQKNNPIEYTKSSRSDWHCHWMIFLNNPINDHPDNNPSEYDFHITWNSVVNEKRKLELKSVSGDGKVKVSKLLPIHCNPVSLRHHFKVNWDK